MITAALSSVFELKPLKNRPPADFYRPAKSRKGRKVHTGQNGRKLKGRKAKSRKRRT